MTSTQRTTSANLSCSNETTEITDIALLDIKPGLEPEFEAGVKNAAHWPCDHMTICLGAGSAAGTYCTYRTEDISQQSRFALPLRATRNQSEIQFLQSSVQKNERIR